MKYKTAAQNTQHIIIILLLCIFCPIQNFSQQLTTNISDVRVNRYSISVPDNEAFVVARHDEITFVFECKDGSRIVPDARFSLTLTLPGKDTTDILGVDGNEYSFKLPDEGNYSLQVYATSQLRGKATPVIRRFIVDDARAAQAKTQKPQATTLQPATESNTMLYLIIAASFVVTVGGLGFVFMKFRSHKTPPTAKDIMDDIEATNSQNLSAVSIPVPMPPPDDGYTKKLEERVAELQEEVRSLRDQINALRTRAEDLGKQNKDLESQVNRLSKVKQELEELQKQKDDLFAIIIHDIKNPASLIKNLVELLRGYDLNSQETQEVMADIVETTTKIVSLSQEFSKIMAMENAQLHIEPMKNDVGIIVESVCRRNSTAAEKKNIKIFADIPDNLAPAEFDPQKIEEVLDNLVSNAIKFSMSGSYINVRLVAAKDTFTIEIEDKGLGLSEEDVKKAFQRGMRLSARPTAGEPSSGLGLWIVKRLVEAHNGSVWVKSTLGKGSTFGVVLPYEQPTS